MIKSEMISFRAENVEERDLSQYISLVQQVYIALTQSSNTQSHNNLNNVAASIRQVVLKNDCLEQKNEILDFFFHCEKLISNGNKKQAKKSNKERKSWVKIVQKNLNNIKGLHNLYFRLRNIQLKRGFACLNRINDQVQQENIVQNNIDPSSIEVEQDIRLKTLYFFRWCKFIQYGNSIKKLRLKQIDDLRKSLTFNQYGVKFSYFHNWRKISKMSAQNKEKFNEIQSIKKKSLFNMTMKSFYGLFGKYLTKKEIKKIEQKLCQKVKQSISICSRQIFFKRLALNQKFQKSKTTQNISKNKKFECNQLIVEKMKYQFLFYLGQIISAQKIKTKTLLSNAIKSEQNYSILCQKSAFLCLKNQIIQTKQNSHRLNEIRKQIILKEKFNSFKKWKNVQGNQFVLSNFLDKNKLTNCLKTFSLIISLKKTLLKNDNQQKSLNRIIQIQSSDKKTEQEASQINFSTKLSEDKVEKSLQKHFEHLRFKQKINEKLIRMKISNFFEKLIKKSFQFKHLKTKSNQTLLYRQKPIFQALKVSHQSNKTKKIHYEFLKSIYYKNSLKNAFKSFHTFKQMRLSHQDCLSTIQKRIINPKQISYAFQKIYERKQKIQSSIKIFISLERAKMKFVFRKCFQRHKNIILRTKQMQKISELRKLKLLFDMLKQNQSYNQNNQDEIRQNVISKISKQRFINLFKSQYQHEQKRMKLFYFIKQAKQAEFVSSLRDKKQDSDLHSEKQTILSKYLSFSLFKTKYEDQKQSIEELQEKNKQLKNYLTLSKLDYFINSLNNQRNTHLEIENKTIQLQLMLGKNNFNQLRKKIYYQKKHDSISTQQKVKQILTSINHSAFYHKFIHYSKQRYLSRWMDWNKKSLIFQKIQFHQENIKNQKKLIKTLQDFQVLNAWNQIKSNIQNDKEILLEKQQEFYDFLQHNRRKQIGKIVSKFSSVKQVRECENHLKNSMKLKYFSKFMRNSLVTKYQKVKSFCAIKSYARNLKQKSWDGLKMMLMRLRDKENKIKTEQQLIVKIDKAMYQSRKTNKLTETIQRFNSSMKKGSLGGVVR